MYKDFITVAAVTPNTKPADCFENAKQIVSLAKQANKGEAEIVVTPELSVTGCSCGDLFKNKTLLNSAEDAVKYILTHTKNINIILIVGVPIAINNKLFNCAIVISKGRILGITAKNSCQTYRKSLENRWFSDGSTLKDYHYTYAENETDINSANNIYTLNNDIKFYIEIGESNVIATQNIINKAVLGAEIIINPSSINTLCNTYSNIKNNISFISKQTLSAYIYCSSAFGDSSQEAIFTSNTMIYECGDCLKEDCLLSMNNQVSFSEIDIERIRSERLQDNSFFSSTQNNMDNISQNIIHGERKNKNTLQYRNIARNPFALEIENCGGNYHKIIELAALGLAKRLLHINSKRVILGVSGGLDSTLALLICVEAFDKLNYNRKDIIGVTMPGFGTSSRTKTNADDLMQSLNITIKTISIVKAVEQHFKDIAHDIENRNVVYENAQARERTQILMDLGNELNALVVGTGDLSELALGWATYNGDHMSMYGVNGSIPKTLIQEIVRYEAQETKNITIKETLIDIANTPISPELLPSDDKNISQKTENIVGPYELHDFFMYYLLRFNYSPTKIYSLALAAFTNKNTQEPLYTPEIIKHWITIFFKRFISQQFKRSCMPDGAKVTPYSLSPRSDFKVPSDTMASIWISECEALK